LLPVALLILVSGLGGASHALSPDCANGHFDDHVIEAVTEHLAGHVPDDATDSASRGSQHIEQDNCNPLLCSVAALTLSSSEAVFHPTETAVAWQVSSLSTLEEPENPDRPPNL
jgi:hypothetical protein